MQAPLSPHALGRPLVTRDVARPQGCTVWLTGLSGAGKSTLACGLDAELGRAGVNSYVLDGDELRAGLNADLGFSERDRSENVRRTGEVARLFTDAGFVVIVALISPYRVDRERIRGVIGTDHFLEVFVDAPLHVCEHRDAKGLYARARAGTLAGFTGVSAPYEPPEHPQLVIKTDACTPDEGVVQILDALRRHRMLPAAPA